MKKNTLSAENEGLAKNVESTLLVGFTK